MANETPISTTFSVGLPHLGWNSASSQPRLVKTLRFVGTPVGKGRPRFTRLGHTYTPPKTRAEENRLKLLSRDFMGPTPAFSEPLTLNFVVLHEPPQSLSLKRRSALIATALPAKRPDLDNIIKLYLDAMNGIVFLDDAQIVGLNAARRYSHEPGVTVEIYSHAAIPVPQNVDGASRP